MFTCAVCGCAESRMELVDEVFQIDGEYVMVEGVPAEVCRRCEERSFSRDTTEKVRRTIHEEAKPAKTVEMRVFEFV